MLNSDIGPVEQVFLTMVRVLDEADQDLVMAELHATANKLIAVNARMKNMIDVYLVDPGRFGSVSLIGELHSILLEATR